MTKTRTRAEIVNYGGHECLCEVAQVTSVRPDPTMMPPADWQDALNRAGIDMPLLRAHVAHTMDAARDYLICDCRGVQGIIVKVDRFLHKTECFEAALYIGQCPECRRVHWSSTPMIDEFTTSQFMIVNGPPRRME